MPEADNLKTFLVVLAGGVVAAILVHYIGGAISQPINQILNSAAGVR